MTLPKELTTVTRFSKILSMFPFILLPFLGFYLGTKYQQSVSSQTLQDNTIQITRPTPTPDPTANWKTYTNNVYAFSIKYPPKSQITEYSQNSETAAPVIAITLPNDSYTIFSLGISKTYKGYETTKEILDSLLEVRKFDKTRHIIYTQSPYTVDKVEGEQVISEETIGDLKRGDIGVSIVKDKQLYSFDLRYRPDDKQKMLLLADQILSTFRFDQ